MRRLLPAIVTVGLLLGPAAPAFAANRVPKGVIKVSVALTFVLKLPTNQKPVYRTFARIRTVAEIIHATDALRPVRSRGVCPMIIALGPQLRVTFRNASGAAIAWAQVQVRQGNRGSSGSSPCFPIRYSSAGTNSALLGNSWVRLMGRLIGTAIS